MTNKILIGGIIAAVVVGTAYYAKPEFLAAGNTDALYVMKETKDGFLRLNTITGNVSLCHPKATSWVCEAVADDREVLEKEIARLEDRIGVLKRHIKKTESSYFKLPSDKEVDEVLSFFERFVKRFKDITDVFSDDKHDADNI